jgi:tRNA (guanosine-2'-O-)-methyltransferase
MELDLVKYLSSFATEERFNIFRRVANNRTRYLTVVLEDIYQPQNASAVLRTCDCLGIQDVHIIENENKFELNPRIELGASKWLTIKKYNSSGNNSLEAIKELKKEGYRIVATSPHAKDLALENFCIAKSRAALVFGSEQPGISDVVKNYADEFIKIPMFGFTESFNLSVSAAIILHQLTIKMREAPSIRWKLAQNEEESILLEWLKLTIKSSDLIIKDFYKNKLRE